MNQEENYAGSSRPNEIQFLVHAKTYDKVLHCFSQAYHKPSSFILTWDKQLKIIIKTFLIELTISILKSK